MKKTLLLMVTLAMCLVARAESFTAYEKKVIDICEKYYTIFTDGYEHKLPTNDYFALCLMPRESVAMAALNASTWFTRDEIKTLTDKCARELKAAESLMTPAERKAAAEKAALAEKRKTPLGKLQLMIGDSLKQWSCRGSFEKTEAYVERLQSGSAQAFEEKCVEALYRIEPKQFQITPKQYDADREVYTLNLYYNLHLSDFYDYQNVTATVAMPIDEARRFTERTTFNSKDVPHVWGLDDKTIVPQELTFTFNGHSYTVRTQAADLIINGRELDTENQQMRSLSCNLSTKSRQMAEEQERVQVMLDQLNARLAAHIDSLNQLLHDYPYNSNPDYTYGRTVDQRTIDGSKLYTPKALQAAYHDALAKADEQYSKRCSDMEYEMKRGRKEKYVEVYCTLHPAEGEQIKKAYKDWWCRYSLGQFFTDYLDNELPTGSTNCRERYWNDHKDNYQDRAEFDAFFDLGEEPYKADQQARKAERELLEKMERVLAQPYQNSIGNAFSMQYTGKYKTVGEAANFEKGASRDDRQIREVVQAAIDLKNRTTYGDYLNKRHSFGRQDPGQAAKDQMIQQHSNVFYDRAIDLLFSKSEKLQKEWEKNGSLFTSKADLWETYITADYKKVLKERKK